MSTQGERYRLQEDVVSWTETDEGVAVLDLKHQFYLAVNESGRALWAMLADGATVGELSDELVRQFGIPEATAMQDASAFLEAVLAEGLCGLADPSIVTSAGEHSA